MSVNDINFVTPSFNEVKPENNVNLISPLNFLKTAQNNFPIEKSVESTFDWKKDFENFNQNAPKKYNLTTYYNEKQYEKYHKSLIGKPTFKDPRYYNNEDLNAQRQGFLGSLFNGSAKMIGSFGQSFVSTFNPIGYDNSVSNAMQDFNKNMENWFPNYYSKEEREDPLSFNSIFSGNFLGDKLIKNLGFMGGAITAALIQDAIIGTITGGTALAPTLALQVGKASNWLSKAFKANTLAAKLIAAEKVESFLAPTIFKGEKALDYFNNMTKGQKLLTSVKTNLFLANASHGEAAIEALEGLTRVKEDLIQSYKEKNGILPNAIAMAEINKLASEAGNIRYGLNFATIFLTDAIQFGSLFKSFKSYTTGQTLLQGLGGVGDRLVLDEAGQLVRRTLSKSEKVLGALTGNLVKSNFSEAMQEGLQYSFETATHDYAKKKWNGEIRGGIGDYLHEQVNGLNRMVTDTEGKESMLLGFLTGFAAHGFKKGVEKIQGRPSLEKREDSIMSDFNSIDFNKMFDTTELSELVKRDVETFNGRTTQEIILNQMQDAVKSGNVFNFKSLQHELFFNGIRTANALGKFDAFTEKLEAMKQLAPEEFSKVFGVEVKDSNIVSQYIDKLKDQAVKTKEIIEAVDNTVPNTIDYKEDSKLWTAFNDLKTTMSFHLSSLDNITNRIDSVTSTLLENNPSLTEDLIDKISDLENFSNKFLSPLNQERKSILDSLDLMSQLKEGRDEELFTKTKQQLKDLDNHIDNLNKHANTLKEHFDKTNNWTSDAILNYKQLVLEVLQYNQQKESGNKIAYTETQLEDTLKALIDFQKLKKSLGIVIDESNNLQTPEGRDKYLKEHLAFLEKYSDSFSEMIKKVNLSTIQKFRDQEISTIATSITENYNQVESIKAQIEEIDKQLLDKKITDEEKNQLQLRKDELLKQKQELLDENKELEETKEAIEGKEDKKELSIEEQIELLEKELSTIKDDNNPRIQEIDNEISELEKLLDKKDEIIEEEKPEVIAEEVKPVPTPITILTETVIIQTPTPEFNPEEETDAPLYGKSRVLKTLGKMGNTLPKDMDFAGGMLQNFYNFMGKFRTFDGNLHKHNLNSFLGHNEYRFVLMVAPNVLYTTPDENGRSEYFTEGTQNPDNIVIVLVDKDNNPVLVDGNYIASKVGKDANKYKSFLNEGKLPDDNQSLINALEEVKQSGFADLEIESTSAGHYNFIGKKEKFELTKDALPFNASFKIFTRTELKEEGSDNFNGYTLMPGKLYLQVTNNRKTVMYLDVSLAKMSDIKIKGNPISKNIFDLINHLNTKEESNEYRKNVKDFLNKVFHTYTIGAKGVKIPAIFKVGDNYYKFEVNITDTDASIRIVKDGEVVYELSKEKQDELSKLQSLFKLFDINDKILFEKEINIPTIENDKLKFNYIDYTDFIFENASPTVNYNLDFSMKNPFDFTGGEIYFKTPSKIEESFAQTETSITPNQSEIDAKIADIERRIAEELKSLERWKATLNDESKAREVGTSLHDWNYGVEREIKKIEDKIAKLEQQETTIDEKTLEGFSSEEDLAKAFGVKPLEKSNDNSELTKEVVEPKKIKIEDIFKDEDNTIIDIELTSSKKLPIVQSLNVTNTDIERVKAIFKGNVNIENLFQIANSDAWATFQQSAITLYKGATRADLFHEAWHHFSQLYLTKDEKVRLYEETRNKVKDLKDKSDLEVEEYIAREFAKFIETGKIEGKFPERKSIFQKIMDFLKSIFSNETDLSLDSLFNNLYKGQINHLAYNTENIMFGKLNSGINDNFNFNDSKLILSGLDALFIKALQYKNISQSQISRINDLNSVYSLVTIAIKNTYKKSFDKEGYSINPIISVNIKRLSDNWNDIKKFHYKESAIFNKDRNLYTVNEDGQIVSTDQNEDEKKGKNKADFQEASERSIFDILPSEIKNLIFTLVDKDKNGDEIIDPIFGLPKLVDFQRYVQVITQKLSDKTDFNDVEKVLTDLSTTYPPMNDLLERLKLNDSNEVKQLRVKFITSMALAKVKLYTILYNEENKDYQAQPVYSNTRRQAESNATSYFNVSPETIFIKKVDGENQIKEISNINYNDDPLPILKSLGIDISFTEYMSEKDLDSFLKSLKIRFLVEHLQKYLEKYGVIKDIFKALDTKIDGQDRKSIFTTIVKADLAFNPAYISATSLNAENKLESENVLWSTITKDFQTIQNAKSISELNQNPNKVHFNPLAVDMDSSVLLDLMFDENGNRTKFTVSVDNYNGINSGKQGDVGIKTKDTFYIEKVLMDINQFINNNILTTMQLSNKATYLGFKLSNKLFSDKQEFAQIMLKYLFSELEIIQKFDSGDKELTKLDKLSKAIGTKDNYNFAIFKNIIVNNTQEIINEYLETGNLSNESKEDILQQINDFFKNELKLHSDFLGEEIGGINPSSGSKYAKSTNKEDLLDDYIKNQFVFNVELSKITFGNTYMHKDPFKRIAGATSTGTRLLVDDLTLQDFESSTKETQRSSVMPLLLERLKLKEYNLKNQRSTNKELRFITFKDREMPSQYYGELLDAVDLELSKHKINSSEYKALSEKKTSIQKAYSKVNGSDAMGAVTMDAWRKFNWLAGRWTTELDKIYEKTIKWDYHNRLLKKATKEQKEYEKIKQLALRNENAITDAEALSISVMKYQYYGNVKNSTIMEKAFHKYQLMPLIPQLIENKLYEHHLDRMIMEDVDYLLFDSADKLEKTKNPDDFYNNKEQDDVFVLEDFVSTYKTGNTSYKVRTGFIENLKEQVFMENGTDNSLLFGTQIRALLFNTDSFSELYDEFRNVIGQLTQIEKDKLYKNASLNEKGEVIDKSKFVQFLLDELDKKVVNYNVKEYLRLTKEGEFAGSLDTNLQRTPIESIINSVIQNKIVKQKIHGEMMVQVSNVGFETFGKKDSLKFYGFEQDGKVRKMEVKVPLSSKFKNLLNLVIEGRKVETRERLNQLIKEGKIDQRTLTMVGYRIPTQEHNSVEVMIVQEFLDPISNLIVVPYEITAKAGSDFDIDKLNIFKPHIDENGNYIEYNESKEQILKGLDLEVKKEELKEKKDELFKDKNMEIDLFYYRKGRFQEKYKEVRKLIDEEIKGIKQYEERLKLMNFILESDISESEAEVSELLEDINNLELTRQLTLSSKNKDFLQNNESKFLQVLYNEYNLGITNTSDIPTGVESILIGEYNSKLENLLNNRRELQEIKNKLKIEAQSNDIKLFKEDLSIITFENNKAIHKLTELFMGVIMDYNDLIRDTTEHINYIKNFKKVKQNRIIEIFEKVLLDPNNFINLITPNSTSLFDEAINNVFKIKYSETERQEKKEVIMPNDIVHTNSLLPRNSWDMHRVFGDSGKGLGIAAVGNKFSQLIQKAKVNFTEDYLEKYNLRFKISDLSNRNFQNGESKATAFSQLINLLVDVANDPRVGYVNMGDEVIPIVNLMINFGIDIEQIIYLINQPIIVDYIKYSSKNSKRLIKSKNDKSSFSSYLSTKALSTNSPLLLIDDNYEIKKDMSATEIAEKLVDVSLENNKENIGFKISKINAEEQLLLLSQFAQFEEMSKDFLELQMTMNFDTNPVQDGFEAFQKENLFEEIKGRDTFTNLNDLKYKTVISPLNVLQEVVNINAQLLPLANSKLIYNFLSSKLSGSFQLNSNKNKARFIRTFKNDYIMYLFQNFLGRSEKALLNFNTTFAPVLKVNEQDFTNKPNEFGIHLIKNLYKEFAEIKNNPNNKDLFNQYLLLDRLFVTTEKEFKNIGLSYYNKDSELQNTYIEQFKELLNSPNLEIRNFMLKFAYMGFYQSGLNKSLISSTDILPIKVLSPILENIREQYLSEINDNRKTLYTLDDFYKLMYDNNEFMRSNKEMENRDGSAVYVDNGKVRRFNSPLNNRTEIESKRFKDYTSNIDKVLESAKSMTAMKENIFQQTTEQPINKEIKPNEVNLSQEQQNFAKKNSIEQNFFDGKAYHKGKDGNGKDIWGNYKIKNGIKSSIEGALKGFRTQTTRSVSQIEQLKSIAKNQGITNGVAGTIVWMEDKGEKSPTKEQGGWFKITSEPYTPNKIDFNNFENWESNVWEDRSSEFKIGTKDEWKSIRFEAVNQPTEIKPNIDSSKKINIYAGTNENTDLSNFAIRPFKSLDPSLEEEIDFKSVEQAFQYFKTQSTDPKSEKDVHELGDIQNKILATTNGGILRTLGKSIKNFDSKNWDNHSSKLMKTLLKQSFEQNPEALNKLLATGNAELTHTQDKGKWGTEFPKLLMEVRQALSNQNTQEQEVQNLKILNSLEFKDFVSKELEKNPESSIEQLLEYYKKCK